MTLFDTLNLSRLGIFIFTVVIAWMTHRSHLFLKEFQPEFNVLLSLPESIIRLLLVAFCLALGWLSGLSAEELGLILPHPWRSIGFGLAAGLGLQVLILAITFQLIRIFGRGIYSPWLIRNILPRQRGEWVGVAVAFLPPVAMEELLFRTLWITAFRAIIPLPLLLVGTSITFGIMHQPQGRLGMVAAGSLNLLFSLIFIWSGELAISLVAHYTINMLQVIFAHFQRDWLDNLA